MICTTGGLSIICKAEEGVFLESWPGKPENSFRYATHRNFDSMHRPSVGVRKAGQLGKTCCLRCLAWGTQLACTSCLFIVHHLIPQGVSSHETNMCWPHGKQPDADLYKANNDFIVEKETWQDKVPATAQSSKTWGISQKHMLARPIMGQGRANNLWTLKFKVQICWFRSPICKKQVTQILLPILNHDVIAKTCRTLFGIFNFSNNRLPQAFIVVKQVFNLTEDSAWS